MTKTSMSGPGSVPCLLRCAWRNGATPQSFPKHRLGKPKQDRLARTRQQDSLSVSLVMLKAISILAANTASGKDSSAGRDDHYEMLSLKDLRLSSGKRYMTHCSQVWRTYAKSTSNLVTDAKPASNVLMN
eukprot:g21842.t1